MAQKAPNAKNKWLAASLNLLPGLGYLYLGKRATFAVLLLSTCMICILGAIVDPAWAESYAAIPIKGWDIAVIIVSEAAFAIDAYNEVTEQ